MNVDKIDIEKVKDIPDIPREERDVYTMLYEEAMAPTHDTRATRGRGRRSANAGTSTPSDIESSSSESSAAEDDDAPNGPSEFDASDDSASSS